MQPLAAVAVAYFIGSFPSAYIYTRLLGRRDIRQVGSGNVGGMNAFRNVGPLPGVLTGVTDVAKGALAVWLATRWFPGLPLLIGMVAVAVVAGHNWMPWLGMRGGKGLGATAGALAVYQPASIGGFLIAYVLGLAAFRDSYAAVVTGMAALPVAMWIFGGTAAYALVGLGLAAAVIAKHTGELRDYLEKRRRR
ncbi:MAG: glycerol-3-phosphate acyltransferase [Bacillota bacterium]|nr:glycerol-3-phosphate acyltransferase [Bacillota bacterium]